MAEIIRRILMLVFSPHCYDEFFINFNFFDVCLTSYLIHKNKIIVKETLVEKKRWSRTYCGSGRNAPVLCLKATISKCLGLGIIAGSIMVKVPQITKIFNSKTAEGISFLSTVLDLFAITSNVAYNVIKDFPFSAWGEGFFLAAQTAVIGILVLYYNQSMKESMLFVLSYLAICVILIGGYTSVDILWSMQALNVPILCVSKLIQAFTNFKNQSTGQLSAVTCFMLFAGALARVFTTIQETGDSILLLTFICTTILNGIIAAQVLWYWNADKLKKID